MDKLRNQFLKIYFKELADLGIGYSFNKKRIQYMKKLLGIIFYIENNDLSPEEVTEIIETAIQ